MVSRAKIQTLWNHLQMAERSIGEIGEKSVFDYDGGLKATDVASQAQTALEYLLQAFQELVGALEDLLPEPEEGDPHEV